MSVSVCVEFLRPLVILVYIICAHLGYCTPGLAQARDRQGELGTGKSF